MSHSISTAAAKSLPPPAAVFKLRVYALKTPFRECCCLVSKSCSILRQPRGLQPAKLLCPWGLSKQDYWSGLPFPSPGDLPDPVIKLGSPAWQADALPSQLPGKPKSLRGFDIIIYTRIRDQNNLIKQESLISLYFGIYVFEMWKFYSLVLLLNLLKPHQKFLHKILCFFSITIKNIR